MDLKSLNVKELKTIASNIKLKNRSKLKKQELIDKLSILLKNDKTVNIDNKDECNTIVQKEPKKLKKKKDYDIKKEDLILLFYSKCSGRENNHVYNDMREYILANILTNKFKQYFDDCEYGSKWNLVKNNWQECLDYLFTTTCKKKYDNIEIIKKGGRSHNFDFIICYLKNGKVIHKITNIEFKNGGKSISEIPQFLNSPANKPFLVGYAEWFYDNYVKKEEPWTRFKDITPSKDIYMKQIYKNESNHPFFVKLKEEEKDKVYYKLKQNKTAESIKKWLEENYKKLDLKELSKEFIRTQNGKIFILWDKDTFNIDTLDEKELNVKKIIGLKNNNTILVNSESDKIQYALLLRWKNHLGILLPAWQISMKRL